MFSLCLFTFMALACYDAAHTCRMLSAHGLHIELNPVIPWLARKFGLAAGVWLGIMVPTTILAILGFSYHPVLELVVPARGFLFGLQFSRRTLAIR